MSNGDSRPEALGRRLRQARLKAGLTVAMVAHRMRLQKTTIQAWERGEAAPDALQLADLAGLCDLATDELLGRRPVWARGRVIYAIFARPGVPDPDYRSLSTE